MSHTVADQAARLGYLEVRKGLTYWEIFHTASGLQVKTGESFRWGQGAQFGFFSRKRDALQAVAALENTTIDWSRNGDYFIGKREIVQGVFKALSEGDRK